MPALAYLQFLSRVSELVFVWVCFFELTRIGPKWEASSWESWLGGKKKERRKKRGLFAWQDISAREVAAGSRQFDGRRTP